MTIFFIWCFFFSFYFLFLSRKRWLLSLPLSLYIYILFYNFTLGWWIIVFFIIYYFGLIQFGSVFDFLSFLSQVFSLPLLAFVWLFFFGQNTWLFWKWNFEFISKYDVGYVFECVYQLLKLNYPRWICIDNIFISIFRWFII